MIVDLLVLVLPAIDDTSADAARASRCSIICVHGTWGRGFFPEISDLRRNFSFFPPKKRWFERGSQFHARLVAALKRASLDWPVRPFLWSGANSVRARDNAARRLSDQLRQDLEHDPDVTAVIIAHSHGGNVALRAVQHLDSMAGRIRVVTLATPFLRVFARQSFELPLLVLFLLWAGVFGILGPSAMIGTLMIWSAVSAGDPPVVLMIGGLFAAALAGPLIVHWLIAIFINPHAALDIAEAARYDTAATASQMLVIRGVDDEASLALAAGSIGSRLSYLVLVGVLPAVYLLVLLFWFPALLLLGKGESLVIALAFGSSFGALLFLVLPGLFKSTFGREFLVNSLACDVAADSVPDTVDRVEAVTLPPEEPPSLLELLLLLQVRHGLYSHSACVDRIVGWLRRVT